MSDGRKWQDLTPDFLDEVAVDLALAGLDVGRPLHRAERLAVARAVVARGEAATAVSQLVGCSHPEAQRLVSLVRKE